MHKKYRTEQDCLNCGATVTGKFCSSCGQENIETREAFWSFLMHSIGHYFHFDSKFFSSLTPLISQPGKLTLAYMQGRRASFFPPVTLYLFISLFFFLILSLDKPDTVQLRNETKNLTKAGDSVQKAIKTQQRLGKKGKGLSLVMAKDSLTAQSVAEYEQQQLDLPVKERDSWLVAYFTRKNIYLKQTYGDRLLEVAFEAVKRQLPKMMFLLMPLFALILSISFYRSKLYFIDHLVYTLHVHSFLYLLYIVMQLMEMAWKPLSGYLAFAALLISVWYIYRSLRTVYQRSRWHTVFKLLLLGAIYFVLLAFCFVLIFTYSIVNL